MNNDDTIGRIAALEDLIALCESDIGKFHRGDLTLRQNESMWLELERRLKGFHAVKLQATQ